MTVGRVEFQGTEYTVVVGWGFCICMITYEPVGLPESRLSTCYALYDSGKLVRLLTEHIRCLEIASVKRRI